MQAAASGAGLGYHHDGEDWTEFTMPGGCVHGLQFRAEDDAWATPAHGQPYMRHYMGGALTAWQTMAAPATGGVILFFDGTTWSRIPSPTDVDLHGIHMIDEGDGWIVGAEATILHLE